MSEENEDEFEDDNEADIDYDDDDEEEDEEDEEEEEKEPMEILRTSAAVFTKGLNGVLKKTSKVALAAKEAAGEMTKKVSEEAVNMKNNLDRTLMMTDMGKILNLLAQVNHAAKFVRLQFSKFTVIITPIIEESLDYLGDEKLNKVRYGSAKGGATIIGVWLRVYALHDQMARVSASRPRGVQVLDGEYEAKI